MHGTPKTSKVTCVSSREAIQGSDCDCTQNILYPSQTAKQEKCAFSQNLLTCRFIICLTTLLAAQTI
jgi:hypothetical protein